MEDRNMKVKLALLIVTILLESHAIGAKEKTPVSPSALIVQHIYEFAPVVDGTEVMHDYVIQNKGSATLEIQKVKTD
jgi:hypothetical protein